MIDAPLGSSYFNIILEDRVWLNISEPFLLEFLRIYTKVKRGVIASLLCSPEAWEAAPIARCQD